jgi:hypothetical protein
LNLAISRVCRVRKCSFCSLQRVSKHLA